MTLYAGLLGASGFFLVAVFIVMLVASFRIDGCHLSNIFDFRGFFGCHWGAITDQKRTLLAAAVVPGIVFGALGLGATAHNVWRTPETERSEEDE